MGRLIFPETFEQQRTLLKLVRNKHIADGANSVIAALLIEKEIDLDADDKAGSKAEKHDASQKLFMCNAENYVEMRDLKFNPVMERTRSQVQFMKSFYKPNVHKLGDWGITVDGTGKINYPPEFAKLVVIIRAIKTKHDSYSAGTSPLNPFLIQHNIDLKADALAVDDAEKSEAAQLDLRRDAELETQQKNNFWNPVVQHLRDIGDYLMKLYKGEQKKLGDHGYTVDDSPRKPKLRKSTVKPGAKITTVGIVLGSALTNIGETLLHIYKGKTTTGTPIVVNPTEKLGMTKGFSAITVVNPSTLITGKFTVLVSR